MSNLPLDVYAAAVARVPAYRRFLEDHLGSVPRVETLEDFARLPFMDKPGYIRAYPLQERCLDGTLRGKHMLAHSSGSSGKHLYWPISREVEQGYWERTRAELEENYGISHTSTLVVLGLLMGGNLSGALFAYVLRSIGIETGEITLATPGRNEEECLEVLGEFAPFFEQTVFFSYGATAKNILETAAARGMPIRDFRIKLRLIGEGYSEAFRDRINDLLGYPYGTLTSVTSGYGATDFRNVGKETVLCIAIKRLLHERGLLQEVLGYDTMPTLCQYNPQEIYVEEDDGELVMTRATAVPLVRYRSGDGGGVMSYEALLALLAKHGMDPHALMAERGYDPARASRNPFVLVSGRRDGLTFCGTKIFVSKIKAVLEETPYLAARLTGEFQMRKVETDRGDPRLEIAAVLREDAPDRDEAEVGNALADALSERQGGIYAAVLAKDREAGVPRIRFVPREEIMTPASFKIRWLA